MATIAAIRTLLAVLAYLAMASAQQSRCPPVESGSGSAFESASGSAFSGGGSGFACEDFGDDETAGIAYFCQSVVLPGAECQYSNYTCNFCGLVRQCDLPPQDLSDLCSNADLVLGCTQQDELSSGPEVRQFFADLCTFVGSTCFENDQTGMRAFVNLRSS